MPLIASTGGQPHAILGLMTFGPNPEAGARITSLSEYTKVLDLYQSRGYYEVDTARSYGAGTQEGFTRAANWKDRGLTLATKSYPQEPGTHKPDELTKQIDTSLKELGTDTVDIFYLHAADRSVPFKDTLATVDKLHKAGKFVRFAISNYTAYEVAEIVMTCHYNGWVRPTLYQGMYNAVTRSVEPELLPALKRYGLDFYAYNPLAGGLFSGKYTSHDDTPGEGRFSDAAGAQGARYRERYFHPAIFAALGVIEPVAKKHDITLVQTALRWLVHHSALKVKNGGPDGVILGVSSYDQLVQNLDAMEQGPLPDDLVKALDEAWKVAKVETPNYWHGKVEYSYDTRKALFDI